MNVSAEPFYFAFRSDAARLPAMQKNFPRLLKAFWTSRFDGLFGLTQDWTDAAMPPVQFSAPAKIRRLTRMTPREWSRFSGYCFEKNSAAPIFVLWPELYPQFDFRADPPRVAGTFNDWNPDHYFEMKPEMRDGTTVFVLHALPVMMRGEKSPDFKFVTRSGNWIEPPNFSQNRVADSEGRYNYRIIPERTGRHVFRFVSETPASLAAHDLLVWTEPGNEHSIPVFRGDFLLQRVSELEPGVFAEGKKTRFRLFAPRATNVVVEFFDPKKSAGAPTRLTLVPHGDGIWEVTAAGDLHGWHYRYFVAGENADGTTAFDEKFPILDPYALAAVSPRGPGIIVDTQKITYPKTQYTPPAPTDLVIVEAHVRDLIAKLPASGARPGFRELAAWIRSPDCYLKKLGVNAVELQPVQEFDAEKPENYHWGYMTNNWFAPASAYCRDAAGGSQIEDFRDLVEACHEAGLAVILDVVFNHVGEPNHLLHVDKTYYFETTHEGDLMNWSGCGNDFRAASPMSERMIIDALRHWIEVFDVDGFRFDLAELLGMPALRAVERELRPLKEGLLLIAEPWSFRGHIAKALRNSSYTSWNDGCRDFFPSYVHGARGADGLQYFLSGSPRDFALHPSQTLNYTESHDDFCWLDRITENAGNNGAEPTGNDARRTRLMAAALFASLGVPMISAGQDFLRSKQGVQNTYLRGDLNALDYARLEKFRAVHDYFRAWIAFRLSDSGAALRISDAPPEGFFRFFTVEGASTLAACYNADGRLPVSPLFFAINPHTRPIAISVPGIDSAGFRQIADADRFISGGLPDGAFAWQNGILTLPALSCGLWR